MKSQILEISKKLETDKIDSVQAIKELLELFGEKHKMLYRGSAIVKTHGNRRRIYEGYTLPIIGLYMIHKKNLGSPLDGTREFKLSLENTPFIETHGYNYTIINERDLEILELETY